MKNAAPKWRRINVEKASREELVAHIDELEFILDQILPRQNDVLKYQVTLGLSRQQAVLLCELASGRLLTVDSACGLSRSWDHNSSISYNHLSQLVTNLRRRLIMYGIKLENVWGQGWRITPETLPKLTEIQIDDRPPVFSERR